MKTVAIIDPVSMVGSAVFEALKNSFRLVLVFQSPKDSELLEQAYGQTGRHSIVQCDLMDLYQDFNPGFPTATAGKNTAAFLGHVGEVDTIINCATVVKPHLLEDPIRTFFVNATWPHLLSRYFGSKLIHLSTDCVFDGLSGAPYDENSTTSPSDLYGLTRSLGDAKEHSLVLRTSTIGPEIQGFDSLIAWVKNQSGKEIKGFTGHLWNGITTKEYGKIIHQILSDRDQYPSTGLHHIYGSDVSKYDMVTHIAKHYQIDVTIAADDGPKLDRRLGTKKSLCQALNIPSYEAMLAELLTS